MHGDTALCEAAGSVKAFMKLNLLGVPFPTNEYGEYIGYQDRSRHKGARHVLGPLTSKVMTEKLEGAVLGKGIPIYDKMLAAEILTEKGRVRGVLALDLEHLEEEDMRWVCFETGSVVLCTGGPAIAYEKSVYPASQTGSTGLALRAGAAGCNLRPVAIRAGERGVPVEPVGQLSAGAAALRFGGRRRRGARVSAGGVRVGGAGAGQRVFEGVSMAV